MRLSREYEYQVGRCAIVLAILLVISSFWIDFYIANENWFGRAGALLVAASIGNEVVASRIRGDRDFFDHYKDARKQHPQLGLITSFYGGQAAMRAGKYLHKDVSLSASFKDSIEIAEIAASDLLDEVERWHSLYWPLALLGTIIWAYGDMIFWIV